ncbi:helix-turn-helix domain-containing protein [Budviciaceae bacterium BWR-B9]|uniref:Helix-turn-helix domain-containing protein n=1 Tax=Limnobaculum allomyrinae TaxID=2791986 RepID=A0ABS1IKS9_9GAMM|nr:MULTISPECIES: sugar diacid recognition domain-containing protein [Limnobaculum]MBK5142355.1 helix-turn-helix domain-containing protein [Limnobaculum allomyrinae]MBV7690760.1 helix-turn-helix domain-containing protein [Limnobaculum sp. M2-1]
MHIIRSNYLKDSTARQIVQRTMSIIHYSVNVMDEHGVIIASGEPTRIHQRHEGAILALTENRIVEIDNATASQLKGVKPGINLPISFQDQLIGVLGISGEPSEVRAYAELVKMAAELIIEQMALLEQKQWDKRYREELVNQLILQDVYSASLNSMVSYLGVNLLQPRVVVIVELHQPDSEVLRNLIDFFEYSARDHLVTFTDFNELVVLKPINLRQGEWDPQQEMAELQRFRGQIESAGFFRMTVGGYFAGEGGIRRSYQTAKATQAMAQRLKLKNKYVFYSDHALPALLGGLADSWQAQELSRVWLKLVAQDSKGILQTTLKQYFEQNCDPSQTAASLYIHINTLRYRLQRIEEITALKINDMQQAAWLYIGMKLQS